MSNATTPRVHPSYRPAVGGDDETRAPGDRLYETGCTFCGGTIDTDGERGYCSKHKGESWYGYAGPEYERRKALRPQPAPVPTTESEGPKVGDYCEGNARDGRRCVGYLSADRKLAMDDEALLRPSPNAEDGGKFVLTVSLRRLPASTPEATATGWICAECNAACGGPTDRCAGCGMIRGAKSRTDAEIAAAKKPDSSRYPHTGFPSAQDLENHAIARDRDIAAIKQHVADFDRVSVRRFGAMRNLDRYGQKLSLRGWDTED